MRHQSVFLCLALIVLLTQAAITSTVDSLLLPRRGSEAESEAEATKTIIWSTTETTVTHPGWIAPTVVTMVTTRIVSTLVPDRPTAVPPDAPVTLVETIIGRTTYEYRMTFSDGHSSTSWASATHTYTTTVII